MQVECRASSSLERYAEAQPILFNAGIVTDKQKEKMAERVCGKYEGGLFRYYKIILSTYL